MMASSPRRKSRIPRFRNREEEAEFWDTHDTSKFEEEFKDVKIEFSRPLVHVLEVELDVKAIDALSRIAAAKGVTAHALAQTWLLERLAHEPITGEQP